METTSVHGCDFFLPTEYTIRNVVGQGAYGMVVAADHASTDSTVAVKKVEGAFEHTTFAKRLLRELRLLRHMQHENIITLRQVLVPSMDNFQCMYVVTDLMETDLASIVKSPQDITNEHCKFFFYQLLRGMKYIHSANVIHRDIKPRNLLVNSSCDLKICDFGLARWVPLDERGVPQLTSPMTEYVCTRWYRAPELLCSRQIYTPAMDVWSVGCVFAELIMRKPLLPGRDTRDQLQLVVRAVGKPSEAEIARITNERCREFLTRLPNHSLQIPALIGPHLPRAEESSMTALLCRMLRFDPESRFTVEEALKEMYFAPLQCTEDEPTTTPLPAEEFVFEQYKLSMAALRDELALEVVRLQNDRGAVTKLQDRVASHYGPGGDCRPLQPNESAYSDDDD